MNYKQKAEQYVREQLPELMELSFGCEVQLGALKMTLKERITHPLGRSRWNTDKGTIEWDECEGHILGHPIQLAHVLRLVNENYRGEFLEIWDLEKSWSEQREGVYIWLCQEWSL